jgi:ligand-binding SRPBCC domain-containing protein
MPRLTFQSEYRCTPEELFRFHERPDVIYLLTPPKSGMRVLAPAPNIREGAEARFSVPLLGPIQGTWLARHTVYDPPHRFVDEQIRGPFRAWRHEHIIEPTPTGAMLIDQIDYEPPLGPLGKLADLLFIRRTLRRMFAYRHAVTRRYVEAEPPAS